MRALEVRAKIQKPHKGPVIDLDNDDDDAVIGLAHDDEDPAPLLGERSTWGLRARASGLPEIWGIATL